MKLAQRYEKLKRENEILKAENEILKAENDRLKEKENFRSNNKILIVKSLNQKFACGIIAAKDALDKFGWNEDMAYQYLFIKGDCVARKRKDGKPWTDQDYINYIIKENKKENE